MNLGCSQMRRQLLILMILPLCILTSASRAQETPKEGKMFAGRVGLQLYSLRDQLAKDVPGSLAKVRSFGIKYVELAGTYGLTPAAFKRQLDSAGLTPVSAHYAYERFRDSIESVIREATMFNLRYVGCAWIPHTGPFDEKTCREAAAVFNRAGAMLGARGITFFYHTHGYEFVPTKEGTLFDLLMSLTHPDSVFYEMDIFWMVHAGQDPARLIDKYPGRFRLLHLKDMKKGTPVGFFTGSSDVSNDVALGTGIIDLRSLLTAARKTGVAWYIIEDESPACLDQIPKSLQYLEHFEY